MMHDELFQMVNLYPKHTGLLMTVWAGPTDERHAPRIKVNTAHGNRANMNDTAIVGILPTPHLVAGSFLPKRDLEAVSAWINLNRAALLAHISGEIDGVEFAARVQKLPPFDKRSQE